MPIAINESFAETIFFNLKAVYCRIPLRRENQTNGSRVQAVILNHMRYSALAYSFNITAYTLELLVNFSLLKDILSVKQKIRRVQLINKAVGKLQKSSVCR